MKRYIKVHPSMFDTIAMQITSHGYTVIPIPEVNMLKVLSQHNTDKELNEVLFGHHRLNYTILNTIDGIVQEYAERRNQREWAEPLNDTEKDLRVQYNLEIIETTGRNNYCCECNGLATIDCEFH